MNPQELKSLADAEFDRALHRKNLKETAMSQMTVPFNGGLFLASPALISYLSIEPSDSVYLEDVHGNPVLVRRLELLELMRSTYNTAMKNWYDEYQLSNRIRRAQNV